MRDDLLDAGAGHYRLVSDCPGCTDPLPASPGDQPAFAGASADFSHVLFESAESLTSDVPPCDPGLGGTSCPIHLYEWVNGAVSVAGVLPDGTVASESQAGQGAMYIGTFPGAYTVNAMSQDGSRFSFTVPDEHQGRTGKLYLRTGNGTPGASTVAVNATEPPLPSAQGSATWWAATPDGSKVLFTTSQDLLASDTHSNGSDVYEYSVTPDAQGHHLTLITAGMSFDAQGVIGISDDASYVYFIAASGGTDHIYVWHEGTVHEVGDAVDTPLLLGSSFGWRSGPLSSRVSPDGTHLVFESAGGTPGLPHSGASDTCSGANGCQEVYVYDATEDGGAGRLVCASCHPGDPQAASGSDATFQAFDGTPRSAVLNRPLSADGRFVFFTTADRLVSEDRNSVEDVYEYETGSGQVRLLSSGAPGSVGSVFVGASVSGGDVFFVTRDRLVGWDGDQQADLYDARVGGGFAEPPAVPVACVGDVCQGSPGVVSGVVVAGSGTLSGSGNLRPPVVVSPKPRSSLVARRLAGALRVCRKSHGKRRRRCESRARKRFGASSSRKASKSGGSR